ncbi:MAG: hypothetical protein AVDCRST_MAG44-274, partial [uncultured Sphingomonas sp.]
DAPRRHTRAGDAAATWRIVAVGPQHAAAACAGRPRGCARSLPADRRRAWPVARRLVVACSGSGSRRLVARVVHRAAARPRLGDRHAWRALDDAHHHPAQRAAGRQRPVSLRQPSQLSCGRGGDRGTPPRLWVVAGGTIVQPRERSRARRPHSPGKPRAGAAAPI